MDVLRKEENFCKVKEFGGDSMKNIRMHDRISFGHHRMDLQRTRERMEMGNSGLG